MRTKLTIIAAALQLVVLVFMAAEREAVLLWGRPVHLRTMPIDPRDIFRGDYVRLGYEISGLPSNFWRDNLLTLTNDSHSNLKQLRDTRVYTALEIDEQGVGMPLYVTDRPPGDALFIRGRLDHARRNHMSVRYGIEAFFVQQGEGLELERGRTREDRMRVPLEMEVAIGRNGLAVLKNYRWSPVGLALTIRTENNNRRPLGARLKLLNASKEPLAIVDLPRGRSFTLEPDLWVSWGSDEWKWVGEGSPPPPAADEHVIVLQPNQSHEIEIDFADPAWFISNALGDAVSLGEQAPSRGWQRFRFVYRPPSTTNSTHLEKADLIWHGHLHSSAFTGVNVD